MLLSLALVSCSEEQPRLELQEVVDLGEVRSRDGVKTFDIAYAVKGGKAYRLRDIVPNCVCITVKVPTDELKPHTKGKIQGTISLSDMSPKTLNKEVRIYTYQDAAPQTVKITGTVVE